MESQIMDRADIAETEALTETFTCPVPHSPETVGAVRRRALRMLTEWRTPEAAAEEAELVISELVTNAVLHALPPVELRLFQYSDGGRVLVRIEVTDAGSAPVWPGSAPSPDERGRGGAVVEALAVRYGAFSRSPGTVTRWADLPAD